MPVFKLERPNDGSISAEGDVSDRNIDLLRSYLADPIVNQTDIQIGQDHINLFAEVHYSEERGENDFWYINGNGRIFSFDELNDDEVIQIQKRYDEIKNDIYTIAQAFSKNKEEEIAIALKNALIIPDNESIYAGEFRDKYTEKWYKSPVVTNWGFKNKENFGARGKELVGDGKKMPHFKTSKNESTDPSPEHIGFETKPAPNPNFPGSNMFWLIWLLVAILAAVIIIFLLPACGINNSFFSKTCKAKEAVNHTAEAHTELNEQIQSYEKDLLFFRKQCAVEHITEQSSSANKETENTKISKDIDDRLKSENATIGDLNFTLLWNNLADLDLYVTCPDGVSVSYGKRSTSCGTLDVDANVGPNKKRNPIEHILVDDPILGSYNLHVRLYNKNSVTTEKTRFQLEIHSKNFNKSVEGMVELNSPWSYTFDYAGVK